MVNIPYYLQGRIDDSFRSLAARKQQFSCTGDVRVRVFFFWNPYFMIQMSHEALIRTCFMMCM